MAIQRQVHQSEWPDDGEEINQLASRGRTVKLIGGGGFLGSMRTTLESTLGGGLKLFLPTCNKSINHTQVKANTRPRVTKKPLWANPHVTNTNLDQMGNGGE